MSATDNPATRLAKQRQAAIARRVERENRRALTVDCPRCGAKRGTACGHRDRFDLAFQVSKTRGR